MGEWPQINWAAIAAFPEGGDDIPIGPRRSTTSSTALTPPVMDGVERFPVTNTVAAPAPKPVDIESHLEALKRKRELQASLARPMTVGEFMDAWLRDARLRKIENDVICELFRAVRSAQLAPTDRRPS